VRIACCVIWKVGSSVLAARGSSPWGNDEILMTNDERMLKVLMTKMGRGVGLCRFVSDKTGSLRNADPDRSCTGFMRTTDIGISGRVAEFGIERRKPLIRRFPSDNVGCAVVVRNVRNPKANSGKNGRG
jgi:hypothetical protein